MSEQGWREFLAAEGVDDWVVLHGGATAVFRVPSLGDSGAACRGGRAGARPRGLGGSVDDRRRPSQRAVDPRCVSAWRSGTSTLRGRSRRWRGAHGAVADRTGAQEVQLAIAAKPDAVDVGFWRAVLGYTRLADDNAVDPLGHGSTVWMQELDPAKPLRHAMHVDVSVAREHVEARLAAALAAGGRIVDDADAPASWNVPPSGSVEPIDEHFLRTVEAFGEPDELRPVDREVVDRLEALFEAQVESRHLDFAARWLQQRGAGFYTIGSAGHESQRRDRAAVARPPTPRCCTTARGRSTPPARTWTGASTRSARRSGA